MAADDDDAPDADTTETESIHPLFRDDCAQRIYACAIMMGRINNPDTCEDVRKAGLDLLAAVIRSISTPETKVHQVRGGKP